MKRYLIVFILICSKNILAQESVSFEKVFNSGLKLIQFDLYSNQEYDDSTYFGDFDFKKFEPIRNNKTFSDGSRYIIYYKNNIIKKIARLSKKVNYEILLFHSNDYTFFTIYKFYTKSRTRGTFINGFFIHNKSSNENYFIGLKKEAFIGVTVEDNNETNILDKLVLLNENTNTKDIDVICLVDSKLRVTSKLNYLNNEWLTFSSFEKIKEYYYEIITIPAKQYILIPTDLTKITISSLEGLLYDQGYDDGLTIFSYPIKFDKEIPIWFNLDRSYKAGK